MAQALDIRVYIGPSQEDKLQSAIEALKAKAEFVILENLTDIEFPKPSQGEIQITKWPKGRIFCNDFELRWELIENTWQSVLAVAAAHELNNRAAELGFVLYELSECRPIKPPRKVFLWDIGNARLGRRLKYECIPDSEKAANQPPVLEIQEYRDAIGYLIFWRYLNLRYEK